MKIQPEFNCNSMKIRLVTSGTAGSGKLEMTTELNETQFDEFDIEKRLPAFSELEAEYFPFNIQYIPISNIQYSCLQYSYSYIDFLSIFPVFQCSF